MLNHEPQPEFVDPAYQGRSLSQVLPAVAEGLGMAARLGLERGPDALSLPEARSYVVFLIDGLGYEALGAHQDDAPFLHGLLAGSQPATVGVPSTTAVSLTSLGTGLATGGHGVVGYTSRVPGTTRLLNALQWSQDIDPVAWQSHDTIFGGLADLGVHTATVTKREFKSSGLSAASTRGAEFVGVDKLGERLTAVQRAAGRQPSLTYAYESDLDWTGHRYGVDSEEWRTQLAMIDLAAERMRESLPASVRLVVIADHGMIDAGPADRTDIDAQPALRDGVILVGGEARFRHVYVGAGAVDDVAATWKTMLGPNAQVLTREEAIARGWFGEERAITDSVRQRLGDLVVPCTGTHAILATKDFPYEHQMIGMHGSLTSAEMLIPVLVT